MNESILAIIALGALAGGGIIVVDAFILRKIRRLGSPSIGQTDPEESSDRPPPLT